MPDTDLAIGSNYVFKTGKEEIVLDNYEAKDGMLYAIFDVNKK